MTDENKTAASTEDTSAKMPANTPAETSKTEESTSTGDKPADAKPTDKPTGDRPQRSSGYRGGQGGGNRGPGGPGGARGRGGPGGSRGRGGRRKNFKREKPEFDQKIVSLRRVTRVMAGGRRFSFSCGIVIGDKKGRVGFGLAKANDTAAAIDKAIRIAKKDMITLKLTENNSIPHDVQMKYKASEILLRPVKGKGLAAGGGVRTVLELAGVDEVGGKLLSRSKNNINNARVTIEALRIFSVKK